MTLVFILARAQMVRAGLRAMLEEAGARVAGSGDDAEAPELLGSDVVLVADEDLLEEAAATVAEDGGPALLALSESDRAVSLLRGLPLRSWGVASPDAGPEELGAAVAAVGEGFVVLPRLLTEQVLQNPPAAQEIEEPLTAREGEVLGLLAEGFSNRIIAGELHISEHTVKFHISSLYGKLGVSSRAEAVSRGARLGLISL